MKLYGALVLLMTLSAVCGLKCYNCTGTKNKPCTKTSTCPAFMDRCATAEVGDVVTKNCFNSAACVGPIKCCEGDLCNSAMPTGSSVFLLLVSTAIMTVFL